MSLTKTTAPTLATLFLVVVAGCSSGESGVPAGAASSPATSGPTPSVDCKNPDLSPDDWTKFCGGTVEGGPSAGTGAVPEDHKIPKGQEFEYTSMTSDGPGTTWSVKLSKMECGLNALPKTDLNPKWDGSEDKPEYLPAKAPSGSDFCVLYWDWQNTGKKPGTTIQSGDLIFGDESHARSSEDETRSWTFMETNLGVHYNDEVNPHKKTKSADIYTVDEVATPDGVMFPMETMVDEEYFLIATK